MVLNFEVIGEAASKIPQEVRDRYDQVESRGTINFRNVMIRDSFRVDEARLWNTIGKNLPAFEDQIRQILDEHD